MQGDNISSGLDSKGLGNRAALSLLFQQGGRPDAAAIRALSQVVSAEGGGFSVVHSAAAAEDELELLAAGLAFDCHGLSPGSADVLPIATALYGLDRAITTVGLEAIRLVPGPHLTGGEALLPVLRVLAGLGLELAAVDGVQAVCWGPAGSWMAADYFRQVTGDWLQGGAFPALGFTALTRLANGALVSTGLDFLIGQEVYLEPDPGLTPAAMARLAVRLIHDLVEHGPMPDIRELTGTDGQPLLAVPVQQGRQLRVKRL